MEIAKLIKSRRSVRDFTGQIVSDDLIDQVLEAGRWAPSGLNNQPWRFVVIKKGEAMTRVAACTKYQSTAEAASLLISVFLDHDAGYDRTKDVQAIGACIENMLLAAHALGLGACWLGEILNQRNQVEKFLEVPDSYELMAVLAIGYPQARQRSSSRKPLTELIFKRIE